MSLGGLASTSLDLAVQGSIASGVTYVVAAGNDHVNACNDSPAASPLRSPSRPPTRPTPAVVLQLRPLRRPLRAGCRHRGRREHVGLRGDLQERHLDGGSARTAAAAMYLGSNPGATPPQVHAALVDNATTGHVVNPGWGARTRSSSSGSSIVAAGARHPGDADLRAGRHRHVVVDLAGDVRRRLGERDRAGPVGPLRRCAGRGTARGGEGLGRSSSPPEPAPAAPRPGCSPRSAGCSRPGRTVYVLGGVLALSPAIDLVLQGRGYTVVRVQGQPVRDAVAIADELGNPTTVFEATGLGFADALSAVPAAIQAHGAILLTNGSTQAPETAAYLAAHPPAQRYAIGGPWRPPAPIRLPLRSTEPDLFATSAAVASTFFVDATAIGAATGLDFPDVLVGGVFMGVTRHTSARSCSSCRRHRSRRASSAISLGTRSPPGATCSADPSPSVMTWRSSWASCDEPMRRARSA